MIELCKIIFVMIFSLFCYGLGLLVGFMVWGSNKKGKIE